MAFAAIAAIFVGCGGKSGSVNEEQKTGLHVQVTAGLETHMAGQQIATIVIQNVFNTGESWVIDCLEKPEQLNGQNFCDELIVLPPGVYEVIVQSLEGCSMTQDHYKIQVKARETVELQVPLVCGTANGGLDVIVTESYKPLITDIDFTFVHDGVANKFICQYGAPVIVTMTVTDHDTACADLIGKWFVLQDSTWLQAYDNQLPDPYLHILPYAGNCQFQAEINPNAPLGDYLLKFKVTDGSNWTWLEFPIHIIDCGYVDP